MMESKAGRGMRLIALDLPGHGGSERALSSDTYSLPGYAAVVLAALEALAVRPEYYWGWSLGGHVLLEALPSLSDAGGVIIQGTPPLAGPADMAGAFHEHSCASAFFQERVAEEVLAGWARALAAGPIGVPDHSLLSQLKQEYAITDPNARSGLAASIGAGNFRDEVAAIQSSSVPLLTLHGEHDPFVQHASMEQAVARSRAGVELRVIPGVGHSLNVERPDLCAQLLADFVEQNGS